MYNLWIPIFNRDFSTDELNKKIIELNRCKPQLILITFNRFLFDKEKLAAEYTTVLPWVTVSELWLEMLSPAQVSLCVHITCTQGTISGDKSSSSHTPLTPPTSSPLKELLLSEQLQVY